MLNIKLVKIQENEVLGYGLWFIKPINQKSLISSKLVDQEIDNKLL